MVKTQQFIDYYKVLGVSSDASFEEIRRQYVLLAKQHHPDAGGSDERMRQLNDAYHALRGPARKNYDRRYEAHHDTNDDDDFMWAKKPAHQRVSTADYMNRTYPYDRSHRTPPRGMTRRQALMVMTGIRVALVIVLLGFGTYLALSITHAVTRSAGNVSLTETPDTTTSLGENTPIPSVAAPDYASSPVPSATPTATPKPVSTPTPQPNASSCNYWHDRRCAQ